jgi:hypothetical protein
MITVLDGKNSATKKHIEAIVKNYIRLFPEDYKTVIEGIQMQKGLHLDEFASAKKKGAPYTRALFEIPLELQEMLITGLESDEMEWFKAGGKNRKEGALWFAKKFKEFALPSSV